MLKLSRFIKFESKWKNCAMGAVLTTIVTIMLIAVIRKKEIDISSYYIEQEKTTKCDASITRLIPNKCHTEIDWKKVNIDELSGQQIFDYFHFANRSACSINQFFGGFLLKIASTAPFYYDGNKAICLDKKVSPVSGRCLVYSIGIRNEWSFDDTMEAYGCKIIALDPSMNAKQHQRNQRIFYYPLGLDSVDRSGWNGDLSIEMKTLSSLYNTFLGIHHDKDAVIDYLKIDIEGMEWEVLPQILKSGMLDRVRQLNLDLHLTPDKPLSELRRQASIVKSLEDYGMVRFASEPNPFFIVNYVQIGNLSGRVAFETAWYNSKLVMPEN